MRYKLRGNSQGQFYFPKIVRDEWGHELELLPNSRSGVIYPTGLSAKKVLKSLKVIMIQLKNRAEEEEHEP